ncbi:MAG: translocation/assembly module TamB domain-containing protein [Bacteroidota bacterium]
MRIIYRIILFSFLLLLSVILIIRIPGVQTYIAGKITSYVNQKTGFKSEITYLNINWFDEIIVEGLEIRDEQDSLMASIRRLDADLDFKALINDKSIELNQLVIENGLVHLIKHPNTPDINLALFLRSLGSSGANQQKKGNSGIKIGEIILADIGLYYDNFDKPYRDLTIDPSHVKLNKIVGNLSEIAVLKDTISANINSLSCGFSTNLIRLNNLKTKSLFTSNSVQLNGLELETGKSSIKGDIQIYFESNKAFADPFNLLESNTVIEAGELDMGELSLFTNIPDQVKSDKLRLSGAFSGPVSRLQGDKVAIQLGDFLDFKGDVFSAGLPNVQETFLDINLNDCNFKLNKFFRKIGRDSIRVSNSIAKINYTGKFTGFVSDFVAKGDFSTEAGDLYTDVNLKVNKYPYTSKYEGFLSTGNLDLGLIFGDTTLFQKIALEGSLSGTGLSRSSADFFLKSTIDKVGINGYEYSNINTDGEFKEEFFEGKIVIDDPNIKLKVDGKIDVSDEREEIKAFIEMDSTNFRNLFLTDQNFIVSTRSNLEINGFGIDRITGVGEITSLLVQNEEKELSLDSALLGLKRVNEDRIAYITSDDINAEISGNFELSSLLADLSRLGNEILIELDNDSTILNSYYTSLQDHQEATAPYSVQFTIDVENPIEYLSPFVNDLYISDQIQLYGGFNKGEQTDLSLNFIADSLNYQNRAITNSYFALNITKESEADKIFSQLEVYSDKQYWTDQIITDDLETVWSWDQNSINFNMIANPPDSINALNLTGDIFLDDGITELKFDTSFVKLDGHIFHFNEEHQLIHQTDSGVHSVAVENLILSDGSQSLAVMGEWNEAASTELTFRIKDIDAANLSALVNRKLDGIVNGEIKLKSDQEKENYFTGKLIVNSLLVDDFLVGDILSSANWNKNEEKLEVDFNINREGVNSIKVLGDVFVKKEEKVLDLTATFDGAKVKLLEPYLSGVASNLAGDVTGQLSIAGSLDLPIVTGDAILERGSMLIDYLQTKYQVDGTLGFRQSKVVLEDIIATDFKGNKAFASGEISHNGFRDLLIDVKSNILNFNVLNTNSKDNDLFYGEAYASGEVSFYGTPKNLKISANAVTNKNTKIFIPLSDESSSEVKDYITFVDFSDTLSIIDQAVVEKDLKGVELDFVLDVTPDAYFELIFDINSGDIIRGRGDGDIKLTVNTEGDFSMFGDYEIKEGAYNFTLYNIINKEFEIIPGSRITWYGDPYKAVLDIEANYSQLVSLQPIIQQDGVTSRSNVIVKLFLDGQMLAPDINFDIEVQDFPLEYSIYIDAFKALIKSDQQVLNRQVFSLLILKKLFEENEAFIAGEAIGASVSEFVSNQLSYWINQVDENLEIDVDFSNLDEDAFNTFQLRLSYKFLDGRLRVTRGGGFGTVSPDGGVEPNTIGSIIGDLTLEYLLTPDGRLRVKMFTRNNRNAFEDNYSFETGASLRYVRSFDYLREIWKRNQVKKVRFVNDKGEEVKQN